MSHIASYSGRSVFDHCRCEYDKTCELLVTLFDQSASSYQQLLQGQSSPQPQDFALREGFSYLLIIFLSICHLLHIFSISIFITSLISFLFLVSSMDLLTCSGQLSWLVYLIGCVVGGKIVHSTTNEYDSMDGQLVCRYALIIILCSYFHLAESIHDFSFSRVLQLMNLIDSNLPQHGSEHLDLAILNFFEQFRKIYVGEVLQKTSEVTLALLLALYYVLLDVGRSALRDLWL